MNRKLTDPGQYHEDSLKWESLVITIHDLIKAGENLSLVQELNEYNRQAEYRMPMGQCLFNTDKTTAMQ